jgi:hypothetical protein
MWLTWFSTVRSDRVSRRPIVALLSPSATREAISSPRCGRARWSASLVVTGLGVVALVGCEVLAATAAFEPSDSSW